MIVRLKDFEYIIPEMSSFDLFGSRDRVIDLPYKSKLVYKGYFKKWRRIKRIRKRRVRLNKNKLVKKYNILLKRRVRDFLNWKRKFRVYRLKGMQRRRTNQKKQDREKEKAQKKKSVKNFLLKENQKNSEIKYKLNNPLKKLNVVSLF